MITLLVAYFIAAAVHFAAYARTMDRYSAVVPITPLSMVGLAMLCLCFWWAIAVCCLAEGYRRFFE